VLVRDLSFAGLACWVAIVVVTGWQIFGAAPIGISNNGDFSKVSGFYNLAPTVGWGVGESDFYLDEYSFDGRNVYHSGLITSEHLFVWPAVKLSRLWFGKRSFNVRMVAAVKLIWFWAAAGFLIWGLSRAGNWMALGLVTIWLMDASTICYLPSFYMDAAALLFAVSLGASLLWWVQGWHWAVVPVCVSAVGMITSKSQHAPLAFVFAIAALGVAWKIRRMRVHGLLVAALFVVLGVWMIRSTPRDYSAIPVFTLTFSRIALSGDLLGLDDSYRKYIGMHAYSEGSPIEQRDFRDLLLSKVSLGTVAGWYARHPGYVVGYLVEDWRRYAGIQPDAGLGWRRQVDGYAAQSQAGGVTAWKFLRESTAPWGTAVGLFAPLLAWRKKCFWPVVLGVILAGAEFGISSLADMLATGRHLFLFQVLTDGLIVVLISLCWERIRR